VRRAGLLVAVLLLAGCGGTSRLTQQEYEHHLKRDALLTVKAITNSSTAASGGRAAYTRRIALAQRDLRRAARDLDALRPPENATAENEQIVRALRFLDSQLGKLRHAAATQNSAEAKAVSDAIRSSSELKALARAVSDLRGKGYDVGVFGG
jgi:hypothetical protein